METTCRYIQDEIVTLDDGTDYTNAVLRRCKLTYNGGPLKIEGIMLYECAIRWEDAAEHAEDLHFAILRSMYAEGIRTLRLLPGGGWEPL